MQAVLCADGRTEAGGSALIMHNERLADPLDSFTEALAGISQKRKKTRADHEAMAHIEFLGGMYTDPPMEGYPPPPDTLAQPAVPAWNVLRCLQDGGKRHRRGTDVPKGVHPLGDFADLQYHGPTSPHDLWQDGRFMLRKSVGIQRARTMRTRPFFVEWQLELPIEIDPEVFDLHTLQVLWRAAGTYAGLGDMRPVYGRFAGTIRVVNTAAAAAETEVLHA